MKTLILFTLTFYHNIVSPLFRQLLGQSSMCRFEVSCSEYAKQMISTHGILTGGKMAFTRFIACQPFTKSYANI